MHRRDLVCLEGWGLHAWKVLGLLGGFGVCVHEGPGVCLQDLGLVCLKGLALLGGFGVFMHGRLWVCLEGVACMRGVLPGCTEGIWFACRIWGLHAWKL